MEKEYELYIKCAPEQLWQAIVDPKLRAVYNFGAVVHSDWQPGSKLVMDVPEAPGMLLGEGEIEQVDPPRLLVHTLLACWNERVRAEGATLVSWQIEQIADSCRLLVTHSRLREDANPELYGGWPMMLSGLKTLLETGGSLTTPGSLRYGGAHAPAAEG